MFSISGAVLHLCLFGAANLLRIPNNPCPNVFQYNRRSGSDEIFGTAVVPYDGSSRLQFSVSASFMGHFDQAKITIQLVTQLKHILNQSTVKYNIFFPFLDVIPKITQITYNGRIYCSGPPEPLTPFGVTNAWYSQTDSFPTSSPASPVRIPENPCPARFQYYKKSGNGEIYGEAIVPYDGSNHLRFSVNASLVGYFDNADLKIQLATPPKQRNGDLSTLEYNIFFPFPDVVPKITQISYNGRVYCSGPPEPLISGTPGVTNVWSTHMYSFSNALSRQKEQVDNFIGSTEENVASDVEIPVKDPVSVVNSNSNKRSSFDDNPFLNSPVSTGVVDVPKPSSVDEKCGVANNLIVPLIIGGTETQEGQYPWLAALFAYNPSKNSYEYRCAANLVSKRHVVTAARCVQYYKIQVVKTEDILIVLGKNDLTHWATNGAVTRGASKVQSHPYFMENSKSAHGDVAVITLNKEVEISKTIRPVCLWEDSEDLNPLVDKTGTLAAWGATVNSKKSDQLTVLKANHVEIPIASQFDCLKADKINRNLTSEMTFCAGAKDGKGPCVGDSGAGFVIPKNRVFYLRGIASIAAPSNAGGLCDLSKYAIFCDVAKFKDWIKKCIEN